MVFSSPPEEDVHNTLEPLSLSFIS